MKLSIISILALILLIPLASTEKVDQPVKDLTPTAIFEEVAKKLSERMPKTHLNRLDWDDEVSETGLDLFLRFLDYDRTVFLAEDIATFREKEDQLDDELKKGDTDFAFEIFALFMKRLENRVAYVKTLLDKGFDVTINEDYRFKRKNAPWPSSQAEQDDLWRRKIKNEYVSRLVSDTLRKEAAERKAEAKKTDATKDDADKPDDDRKADAAKAEARAEKAGKSVKKRKQPTPKESILKKYEQFLEVYHGHDAEFVAQNYLTCFTRAYDTHSTYMAPRAKEDFDIDMGKKLTGIGAVLYYDEGAAVIREIIKGGPAEKEGSLKSGDRIVAVAQGVDEEPTDVMYWPLYRTVRKIRGEVGTTVVLTVIPADAVGDEEKEIVIVRDFVELEDQAAKFRIEDVPHPTNTNKIYNIGIIDLPDFYEDMAAKRRGDPNARSCAADVKKILLKLKAAKVDGVILDLRNNGGGSLSACVEMTGFFIPQGPVVRIKNNRGVQSYYDQDRSVVYGGPLAVLVNRHSASASEILAAAMQDYNRAIIIGDSQTHGKGTVQTILGLGKPEMGQFKVTTAGFYRIDGKSTQLKGVTPDVIIPSPLDFREIGEKYLDNVLPWSTVERAAYRPYGMVGQYIDKVIETSEQRRTESPDFKTYGELVEKLKERYDRTEISLHLEKRTDMAREDRELNELAAKMDKQKFKDPAEEKEENKKNEDEVQNNVDAEAPDKQNIGDGTDLILEESLLILRDAINEETKLRMLRDGGA